MWTITLSFEKGFPLPLHTIYTLPVAAQCSCCFASWHLFERRPNCIGLLLSLMWSYVLKCLWMNNFFTISGNWSPQHMFLVRIGWIRPYSSLCCTHCEGLYWPLEWPKGKERMEEFGPMGGFPPPPPLGVADTAFFQKMNIFIEWIIRLFFEWMNSLNEYFWFSFEWINSLNEYFRRTIEWIIEWIKKVRYS